MSRSHFRENEDRASLAAWNGEIDLLNATDNTVLCVDPSMISSAGFLQGDDPMDYAVPLFILRVCLIVGITRLIDFILRPLRQPRVVAELLGGLVLSPSVLGSISPRLGAKLFPMRAFPILDVLSYVGLSFFLFIVAIELDLTSFKGIGWKAAEMAVAGMVPPFIVSLLCTTSIGNMVFGGSTERGGAFALFLAVALSATAFPVLARVLGELRMLNSDVGRLCMTSAMINDVVQWPLVSLAVALAHNQVDLSMIWIVLSDDFCYSILLPILFVVNSMKASIKSFGSTQSWGAYFGLAITGYIGRICGTLAVSSFHRMPFREGLCLGVLMNCKGLMEVIVFTVAREVNNRTFAFYP